VPSSLIDALARQVTVRRLAACSDDRVPVVQGDLEVALPPSTLLRSDAAKDAELLVLRYENAVLRRHCDSWWVAAPWDPELAELFTECGRCLGLRSNSRSCNNR
jgi:hypothetical protein